MIETHKARPEGGYPIYQWLPASEKKQPSPRKGLVESLEEYQSRHGRAATDPVGRQAWRLEAMRLLGLERSKAVPDGKYQPRVCNQPCPTRNGPTLYEEDDIPPDLHPYVDEGPL